MTKLFDRAIAKVRELLDEDQDALGALMLSMIDDVAAGRPFEGALAALARLRSGPQD